MENIKLPAVYILASRYRGTLYVGVTSELYNRVHHHKNELFDGFTKDYQVKTLAWYSHLPSMDEAIRVEKQITAWKRQWKIELIEKMNKNWNDLHEMIDGNLMYTPPTKAGPQLSLG
ncbi:MAG: GIY-YIG nuclease family protein [Aestuariivirga sp.]